jgi:prephenate dehydrogenase
VKIVGIGGTGLIGSKLLNKLREHGHETVAATPNTGVNTVPGEARLGETRFETWLTQSAGSARAA